MCVCVGVVQTTIIQRRCCKQPKQPDVCGGNWEESEGGDRGAQATCHKCNRLVIIESSLLTKSSKGMDANLCRVQ